MRAPGNLKRPDQLRSIVRVNLRSSPRIDTEKEAMQHARAAILHPPQAISQTVISARGGRQSF
jgi:hypothetical protein